MIVPSHFASTPWPRQRRNHGLAHRLIAHSISIGLLATASLALDPDPARSPQSQATLANAWSAPAGNDSLSTAFERLSDRDARLLELASRAALDEPGDPRGPRPATDPTRLGMADWVQRDKLRPSDGVDGVVDEFGWSAALDGDTAIVLACAAPGGSSVYVYIRENEIWSEQAKLTPFADLQVCDGFLGGSVALEGDTALVGLPAAFGDLENGVMGAVVVYTRLGGEWTEQAILTSSGSAELFDYFGREVALDGDTALVTAFNFDDLETIAPAVYAFSRAGEMWKESATLLPPNEPAGLFGWDLALDGDTALVAESGIDEQEIPSTVHVFTRDEGEWVGQAELIPVDGATGLDFGHSVALDAGTALVGASRKTLDDASAAYVFARVGETWIEQAKLHPLPEHDGNFGRSTNIQGDTALVGAEGDDIVYVFTRGGDEWTATTTLEPPPDETGLRFGRGVALDGDTAVVSNFPVGITGSSNGWAYAFDTREPAPAIGLVPSALDFGEVAVGQVSDSGTATLRNNGAADLVIGDLVLGGADAEDFVVTADTCSGQVIALGETCSIEAGFAPTDVELRTAQVDVPSNAPTAPDELPLSGTGTPGPPTIRIDPDHFTVVLGQGETAEETMSIGNVGTFELAWEIVDDPGGRALGPARPSGPTTAPGTRIDLAHADLARVTVARLDDEGVRAHSSISSADVLGPGATLTHSASLDVDQANTPRCVATDEQSTLANKFLRTFTLPDFGIVSEFDVHEVSVGVEQLTAVAEITINLYTLEGEFVFENLTQIGTATATLDPQELTVVAVPATGTALMGSTLVVEIDAPSLADIPAFFTAGSNSAGESAPSYLAAPGTENCNINQPTSMADLGFPDTHLVMTVTGTVDCTVPEWLDVGPLTGTLPGGTAESVTVTFDATGLPPGELGGHLCVASNDPMRPLVEIPASLTVTEGGDEELTAVALQVDSSELAADSNGVFEPGESVDVAPAWRNDGTVGHNLSGTASDFTGPEGAAYDLEHDEADYGLIDPGQTASCLDTGVCYRLGLDDPSARPATHWEATFDETLDDSDGTSKTWILHIGGSFTDVPSTNAFYPSIETLLHSGVTGGCTDGEYCPAGVNSRAQMPVFVLKALEGAGYAPPACVEGAEEFTDVPFTSPFCPWIEELAERGVVAGCGGGNYCPGDPVTRAQMAIFLLKTLEGDDYTPPECTARFDDVACPSLFADWIEDLATREITGGCSASEYCPGNPVSRAQMAVFVIKTFGLTLYGPQRRAISRTANGFPLADAAAMAPLKSGGGGRAKDRELDCRPWP